MKRFLSVVLALMLLVAATGCSSTGGSNEKQTTETSAAAEAETTEDVVTVKLALWDYEADGSVYPPIIEAFEAANPGIKVEVINASSADYETKITTMLAGGDDIDVYFAKSNTSYPTLVLKNYAMDLNGLVEEKGFDTAAFGTVLEQHYVIDGGLYALPFRTNDWVIYYNKSVFDNAGVPYPTNDMTWEEYAEIAKSVTSEGVYGAAFIPKAGFIVPVLVGVENGFDIASSDFTALQYPLEYMLKLMNEDQSYENFAQSVSMSQDQTYFYKGTTGMIYNGSWFTQMLVANEENIDFEWGIVKSPYWAGTEKAGFATSTPVLINSKTEKVDEAWELLTYLTGNEGAELLAKEKLVPGYKTDEVMQIFKDNTGLDDASMEALTDNTTYVLGEASTLLGLISGAINEEVELVMTENQTPAEAVANMEVRRQEILEANK